MVSEPLTVTLTDSTEIAKWVRSGDYWVMLFGRDSLWVVDELDKAVAVYPTFPTVLGELTASSAILSGLATSLSPTKVSVAAKAAAARSGGGWWHERVRQRVRPCSFPRCEACSLSGGRVRRSDEAALLLRFRACSPDARRVRS